MIVLLQDWDKWGTGEDKIEYEEEEEEEEEEKGRAGDEGREEDGEDGERANEDEDVEMKSIIEDKSQPEYPDQHCNNDDDGDFNVCIRVLITMTYLKKL